MRSLLAALSLFLAAGPAPADTLPTSQVDTLSSAPADPAPADPAPADSSAVAAPTDSTPADTLAPAQEDPQVAVAMAEGYLRARSDDGILQRGPLHTLATVTLEGPPAFTADRLGLAAYAGRPASAAQVQSLVGQVRAWLLDHGHPFAEASLDLAVREDRPLVDLKVLLRPGAGYKYGGYKAGGSRTRPAVLERLALLRFGEDFSETRLRLAARRLARTGYFEAVIPGALYRDSTRNLLYPTVALSDFKGNRLGGILGYDSEQEGEAGLNGYLDIHLINMRGTARDLDFAFEAKSSGQGPQERELRFAFVEPWILGGSLGGRLHADIALQDSVYNEANLGFSIFQDMGFHSRWSAHFARQDNRDYAADQTSTALSTGLGLLYDARDRVPGTLRGLRLDARVTGLRRDLGDSSYYLSQGTLGVGGWANRGRWVAHARLSTGGNWPLAERANRGELFQLGGANTVRGYREKEFLSDLYVYSDLEAQFLLAPWSRATLFVVPGLINRATGDVHWRRVLGYGLGMEAGGKDWTFGISYALNPGRGIGDGFIHMRVVNNF